MRAMSRVKGGSPVCGGLPTVGEPLDHNPNPKNEAKTNASQTQSSKKGYIVLTANDFIAADWPELICEVLSNDKQVIAREAICHVNDAAKQVEEMICLFPANRERYIRSHTCAARRIMHNMAVDCELETCNECGKYFFSAIPRLEYCDSCWQDLRDHAITSV